MAEQREEIFNKAKQQADSSFRKAMDAQQEALKKTLERRKQAGFLPPASSGSPVPSFDPAKKGDDKCEYLVKLNGTFTRSELVDIINNMES